MGPRGVQKDVALIPVVDARLNRAPRRRLRWLVLSVFVVALLVLYVSRNPVLTAAARFLDISEPVQATDYVMVLGGNVQIRPFVAAALLNAGLARKALVAKIKGSGDDRDGIVPSEQEMIRAVLVHEGVPPGTLRTLPRECASTFDEARALADFLQTEPDGSVAVVTSRYHTRRTCLIFRKIVGKGSNRLRFVGAPVDGFDETNWWHFESGITTYLDEYLKLAFYLMRY
jgi:uncharacterized SAM-binding protein YcdF (DUF218 family)